MILLFEKDALRLKKSLISDDNENEGSQGDTSGQNLQADSVRSVREENRREIPVRIGSVIAKAGSN